MKFIAPIIEGHGEGEAVPALLHRIVAHAGAPLPIKVNPPIRIKSGSFLNDDAYFRKYILLAAAKAAQANGLVLILMDCDQGNSCPAILGPALLKKARDIRPDVEFLVVLALKEFETWFIAAIESLSGRAGLAAGLARPDYLENIRDAKGWLGKHMDVPYDPIIHQYAMTKMFDLQQARSVQSFDRFYRRIAGIVGVTI
jgi:hypothetical protein